MEILALAVEQVTALAGEKKIALTSSAEGMLAVPADRDKIVRVLVNLIGNAIKFTPNRGRVQVSVSDYLHDGRSAVIFSVRDNGIGIAAAHLPYLFDEGFRVDVGSPTSRSLGLGLTFCKRVVEAHKGRIWCKSAPGEGSVFSFSLPLRPTDA